MPGEYSIRALIAQEVRENIHFISFSPGKNRILEPLATIRKNNLAELGLLFAQTVHFSKYLWMVKLDAM